MLRACKALLSEWRLAPKDWPAVLEAVQAILNHSPLRRLGLSRGKGPGYRTPSDVFTGQASSRPLIRALPPSVYGVERSMDAIRARQLVTIDTLQSAVECMHKEVNAAVSKNRERSVAAHNRRTNVRSVQFEIGDFVLVRQHKRGHKLSFVWKGPCRVKAAKSAAVYNVEDLLTGKISVVHYRRMMVYRLGLDGMNVDKELLKDVEHGAASYEVAEKICGIRRLDGDIELHVLWEGLPDHCDKTWEPLMQLIEDAPIMVLHYLQALENSELKRAALALVPENITAA